MPLTLNTKVFTFAGLANAISNYVNAAASGIVAAYNTVTATVRPGRAAPKSSNGADVMNSTKWKLTMPIVADGTEPCSCEGDLLRYGEVNITINTSPRSTTAERTALALSVKDLTASPEFQASVISLAQPTS